jgi:hypothetical protein
MQVSLEALVLWEVVEKKSQDRAKDQRALAAVLRGIPPEMKARLAVKKSAKEAWDSVKKMHDDDEREGGQRAAVDEGVRAPELPRR